MTAKTTKVLPRFYVGQRVELIDQNQSNGACRNGAIVFRHGEHDFKEPRVRWASGWGTSVPAGDLRLMTPEEIARNSYPALSECDYATACLAAKGGSPALLTPVESEKAATGQGLAGIKGSEAVQTLLKCAWLEAVNGNKLTMPQIAALLRAANLLAGKGDV